MSHFTTYPLFFSFFRPVYELIMQRNYQRIVFLIHFRIVLVMIIVSLQFVSGGFSAGAQRLQRTADALLISGEKVVAAAALLGENGILAEDPASLSNGGCALSNAGRDLNNAFAILYANDGGCEWEEAANEGQPHRQTMNVKVCPLSFPPSLPHPLTHFTFMGRLFSCSWRVEKCWRISALL